VAESAILVEPESNDFWVVAVGETPMSKSKVKRSKNSVSRPTVTAARRHPNMLLLALPFIIGGLVGLAAIHSAIPGKIDVAASLKGLSVSIDRPPVPAITMGSNSGISGLTLMTGGAKIGVVNEGVENVSFKDFRITGSPTVGMANHNSKDLNFERVQIDIAPPNAP
jgi:hypothetical protein